MNIFKYEPYYKFFGPSLSDPIGEELSQEDQERNIGFFYDDVQNTFADDCAVVSKDSGGIVSIETTLSKDVCGRRVEKILISLKLSAHIR